MMAFMQQLLAKLGRAADLVLDRIIWLIERTKLFVALMLVVPLLAVAVTTLFYDVRAWVRPAIAPWGYATAVLVPAWIAFCILIERSTTPRALRLRRSIRQAPLYIAGAILVTGLLLLLFGRF